MIFSERLHAHLFGAGVLLVALIIMSFGVGSASDQGDNGAQLASAETAGQDMPQPQTAAASTEEPLMMEESEIDQFGDPSGDTEPMISSDPIIEAPASAMPEMDDFDSSYGRPMATEDFGNDF